MKNKLNRLAAAAVLAVGLTIMASAPVAAATPVVAAVAVAHQVAAAAVPLVVQPASVADVTAPVITFDLDWPKAIQFALAIVLPLLVAIVTKVTTPGRKRGILLAVLTLATTILTQLGGAFAGIPLELAQAVLTAGISFLVSVGFYFGLWGTKGPAGESVSSYLIKNVGPK